MQHLYAQHCVCHLSRFMPRKLRTGRLKFRQMQQDGTEEGSSLNSETSEEPEESQDMTSGEEALPAESQDDVQ